MSVDVSTKCIHLENESKDNLYGAVSFPIFQTATFAHPSVGNSTGYDYSRLQNPTREHLEKVVASLENGLDALAFTSGMAAISTLMELFHPGDHLIADADLYGGTVRLFDNINEKNGIEVTKIDCVSENVENYIKENTKAIYIETPTNPMMNVIDIEKLSAITKKRGIWLGDGVAEQVAISTPRIEPEIKQLSFNDMAFIITEEAVIPFKKVVTDKEDADEK